MLKTRDEELILPEYRVEVDGLSIHYKRLGAGPPVILLHGGGNDWREWEKNLPFLAGHFEIYALDLPGFGLSQWPDETVSRSWSIDFLRHFLDSLGLQQASFIGHSMGAMLAAAFAARYPAAVDKLILVDAAGLGSLSPSTRLLLSFFHLIDRWQGKKRGPRALLETFNDWQILDALPAIQSATLIVWGQRDIYLPVAQAKLAHSLIHECRLSIFPACGHAPQREAPAKFNALCLEFLSGEAD
jgi:2-hydroxy-6-oxonona-2,4-dienedioate hydrolase